MASLRRLPNSPYWIACFSLPDDRQTQRSTNKTNRGEALRVAIAYEDASKLARAKQLTGRARIGAPADECVRLQRR